LKFVILAVMRPGAARWASFSEIDETDAVWTVPPIE
jgi:hypothetical protein